MINIQKIENIHVTNIKHIIHIADIHIRLQKRHEEYRTVFSRLYSFCKEFKLNHPDTVIFVGGDIAHSKTDMSPEQINLIQDFFKSLSNITDTIVIAGNHDMNLNNKTRLDALAPIINALDHPNLFYLKDTNVYQFGNVYFNVMGVSDKPVNFIKASDIPNDKIKIALHHGAVNQASTAVGFQLTNDLVNTDTFAGHEITLLGDIHKFQYLNSDKTIAYCSSLIQQNFGETLDFHGLLVWDIDKKESEFIEIENDYGYVTLEVSNGIVNSYPSKFPKKPRIKLKLQDTTSSQLKTLTADLKSKYNVQDIVTQKVKEYHKDNKDIKKISLGNVRDIEFQNTLLTNYLVNKLDIDEDYILDGVRHINRTINSKLQSIDKSKNITYNLIKLEFSNMFSYGEDNIIDFSKMNGVHGLFASNRSGKSSLLDSLLYCIFDKCTKTDKASYVLNNKKDSFTCKLEIEINNKRFIIERTGVKNKTGHVRVSVNFYTFDDFGNIQSLNGQERDETNSIIRSYLGTYKDFILTSVVAQNNNTGFIEMSQKERKELLSQFLDINIFDELQKIATDEIKDVHAILKDLQKQDFSTKISQADLIIRSNEIQVKHLKADQEKLEKIITGKEGNLLDIAATLIPLSNVSYDLKSLEAQLDKSSKSVDIYKSKIDEISSEIGNLDDQIRTLSDTLNTFDIDEIESSLNQLKLYKEQFKKLESDLRVKQTEHTHILDKMKKLESLEYDENCTFCMNNIFVKDAIQTKESLSSHQNDILDLENKGELLNSLINNLLIYEEKNNNVNSVKRSIQKSKEDKTKLDLDLRSYQHSLTNSLNDVKEAIMAVDKYNENKESIEFNLSFKDQIGIIKTELRIHKNDLSDINSQISKLSTGIELEKQNKKNALDSIEKLRTLEREYKFYELYLSATNRNGIPYDLICNVMPQIEMEINNVLGQIVDFTIMLQTDEKNINAYIVYDDDNFWPLDLTSGMERFISSLAIRNSLINITNLPKPNFIAIDEGFTQLDSDNLGQVYHLFSYLKTQFDFMMIISHIDVMRDMVDHFIDIRKEGEYSKISII
jgi:DNA repair exonuclease SbcCD ATPase subunit